VRVKIGILRMQGPKFNSVIERVLLFGELTVIILDIFAQKKTLNHSHITFSIERVWLMVPIHDVIENYVILEFLSTHDQSFVLVNYV
jgi:hypothetical protein